MEEGTTFIDLNIKRINKILKGQIVTIFTTLTYN